MSTTRFRQFIQRYPKSVNIGLIFLAVFITLFVWELGFRLVLSLANAPLARDLKVYAAMTGQDNTRILYEPHPYLAYIRTDTRYEKDGIRIGDQFYARKKNPDVVRIACLGGSTTQNQFTDRLQEELMRYSGRREFEVMDFGCNGWTLMESTINYVIRVSEFEPDAVLVHHGMNDAFPRRWAEFKPDYSHYRSWWNDNSNPIETKLASISWFAAYLQMKRGINRTALKNFTVHPNLSKSGMADQVPETLQPYRRNLLSLIELTRVAGSKIVLAPMPYNRDVKTVSKERYGPLIEEHNVCMRELSEVKNVPLAEADVFLQNHPDRFKDIIHVDDRGNRLKTVVYARAIWEALEGHDKIAPFPLIDENVERLWSGRTVEIRWNLGLEEEIADYHVYVRNDPASDYVYLGQTRSGTAQSLIWKKNAKGIAGKFALGPAHGRKYEFIVFALPQSGKPPALGPFSGADKITSVEK